MTANPQCPFCKTTIRVILRGLGTRKNHTLWECLDCRKTFQTRKVKPNDREMLPAIGSRALVRFETILVECTVSDAKFAYGNARVLVSPVSGQGQQWVDFSRLMQLV